MKPVLRVSIDGREVSGLFYQRLSSISIRDEGGSESDSVEFTFDNEGGQIARPRKKAKVTVSLGYEGGLSFSGKYEVDKASRKGGADGEVMIITARAADLQGKLKERADGTFENKTLKEIAANIAGKADLSAEVDATLSNIKVPFVSRSNQSGMDFITRLAARHGGIVKVMGGKLIIAKRGATKTVSGKPLPSIRIYKENVEEWEFSDDPRPIHGKVEAQWTDRKTGKKKSIEEATGFDGPAYLLRQVFPNEDDAKQAAKSEVERINRRTGTGSITCAGRPDAQAEADVICIGFGEDDGLWRASSVEHSYDADGFRTTISLEAPETKTR
jgi:uncharacterized protein